jgi:hypothetical protein
MPTLAESRDAFVRDVGRFTPREKLQFTSILDDFITWSATKNELEHADHDYKQGVVSFRITPELIFWSAYPKAEDNHGAKFEILPGSASRLSSDAREHALKVLKGLTDEPISMETTLRIRFAALRSNERRERVKSLLETLIIRLRHEPA